MKEKKLYITVSKWIPSLERRHDERQLVGPAGC